MRTTFALLWIALGAFIAAMFCLGTIAHFATWFGWIDESVLVEHASLGWTSFAYLIATWVWAVVVLVVYKQRQTSARGPI